MRRFFLVLLASILFSPNILSQCSACEEEVQLIQNGNFSQGNTGFSTDLSLGTGFLCPLCPEGTYGVGQFAWLFHSDFIGQDHTNPPFGQFMIINGTAQEGVSVWCQNVNVAPNTNYTFSYWVRDASSNSNPHPMGVLHASFNGELIGDSIVAEGGWSQNIIFWNSGSNTSAEICIVNYQSNPGGNDFGLDDIELTGCHPIQLSLSANAGDDQTICSGATVSIGVHNASGYSYNWSNDANQNIPSIGTPSIELYNTGLDALQYTFNLELDSASVGCISTDTVAITVLPNPVIELIGDTELCAGEQTTLSANGFYENVEWNTGATTSSITVSETGYYEVTASADICVVTEGINVEVISLPIIDLGADLSICETSLPLIIESPVYANWNTGEIGTTVSAVASGEYIQFLQESDCISSDTIQVNIYTFLQADVAEEYFICEDGSVELFANLEGQWSNGSFGSSATVFEPGIYSIQVNNGPCSSIDGTEVLLIPDPLIDLGPDVTICEGESVRLNPFDENIRSYFWNDGSQDTIRIFTDEGIYLVEVSNECGSASDDIFIDVEICDWSFFAPTAFTPNGDDRNEGWRAHGYNISNVKIFIYNRLGDLVWQTEDLNDTWMPDALTTGQDVYNYRAEGIDYQGNLFVKYGIINLLR